MIARADFVWLLELICMLHIDIISAQPDSKDTKRCILLMSINDSMVHGTLCIVEFYVDIEIIQATSEAVPMHNDMTLRPGQVLGPKSPILLHLVVKVWSNADTQMVETTSTMWMARSGANQKNWQCSVCCASYIMDPILLQCFLSYGATEAWYRTHGVDPGMDPHGLVLHLACSNSSLV